MPLHMDVCEEKGLPWPPPVPIDLECNDWFLSAPKREQEIICMTSVDKCIWVDTSQNASRVRASNHLSSPTVTPGSHLWHFPSRRFLTGRDLMRLQGIPMECFGGSGLSDNQLSDLAGNAFSSSVSLALDVALLLLAQKQDAGPGLDVCTFLRSLEGFNTPASNQVTHLRKSLSCESGHGGSEW